MLRSSPFFNADGVAYFFHRTHDVMPSAFDLHGSVVCSTIIISRAKTLRRKGCCLNILGVFAPWREIKKMY